MRAAIKKLAVSYGACLLCFSFPLLAVGFIPVSAMSRGLEESIGILAQEGEYPMHQAGESTQEVDNFTVSLMLRIAACDQSQGVGILSAAYYDLPGDTSIAQSVEEMEHAASGSSINNYGRYWHGWLVFLKPLLLRFNISQIQSMLFMVEVLLLAAVCAALAKRTGILPALALAGAFAASSFQVTAYSLPFAASFVVALLFALLLLSSKRAANNLLPAYFVCGAVTVYFDFLNTPLLSLGVPLAVMVFADLGEAGQCTSLRQYASLILRASLAWGLGYASLWVSKWIIASLVSGQDLVFGTLFYAKDRVRSGAWGQTVTGLDAIRMNLATFFPPWTRKPLAVAVVLLVLAVVWVTKRHAGSNLKGWRKAVALCVIACIPMAWHFFLAEHSYIHFWFVFRDYLTSLLCVVLAAIVLFGNEGMPARPVHEPKHSRSYTIEE